MAIINFPIFAKSYPATTTGQRWENINWLSGVLVEAIAPKVLRFLR